MPEKGRRSLGSTPGLVGSRTSLGSGLVWLESVGNKWTEQGLFIQGPPCPITHWAWQPQFFPGPGDFGGISHNLSPRPLFSAGLTAAQPQDWENCPKRAEKAGRKLMSSLLADYRPCILRCPTHGIWGQRTHSLVLPDTGVQALRPLHPWAPALSSLRLQGLCF